MHPCVGRADELGGSSFSDRVSTMDAHRQVPLQMQWPGIQMGLVQTHGRGPVKAGGVLCDGHRAPVVSSCMCVCANH